MHKTLIFSLALFQTQTACSTDPKPDTPLTLAMVENTLRDCGVAGTYSVKLSEDGGTPVINMGKITVNAANVAALAGGTDCFTDAFEDKNYFEDRDFIVDADISLSPEMVSQMKNALQR